MLKIAVAKELKREEFYYEGGIAEYVQHINKIEHRLLKMLFC